MFAQGLFHSLHGCVTAFLLYNIYRGLLAVFNRSIDWIIQVLAEVLIFLNCHIGALEFSGGLTLLFFLCCALLFILGGALLTGFSVALLFISCVALFFRAFFTLLLICNLCGDGANFLVFGLTIIIQYFCTLLLYHCFALFVKKTVI